MIIVSFSSNRVILMLFSFSDMLQKFREWTLPRDGRMQTAEWRKGRISIQDSILRFVCIENAKREISHLRCTLHTSYTEKKEESSSPSLPSVTHRLTVYFIILIFAAAKCTRELQSAVYDASSAFFAEWIYLWCIFTLCVALLLLLRWCHWCYYYFCMRFRGFAVGRLHSVSRPKAQIRRDVLSNGEYRKRAHSHLHDHRRRNDMCPNVNIKVLVSFRYIFFSIASRRRLTRFASLFFFA